MKKQRLAVACASAFCCVLVSGGNRHHLLFRTTPPIRWVLDFVSVCRKSCAGVCFFPASGNRNGTALNNRGSNKTLERITKNLQTIDLSDAKHAEASINSYLGVLSHSASYNIKQQLSLVA